ncbi:phosphotransferase family protein [Rhodococcus aerolatus]
MPSSTPTATTPTPTTVLDPVSDVLDSAERLLARRTGAPVVLADPEDLGGSGRSVVLRVRVAENPFSLPRTLVVKQVRPARGTDREHGPLLDVGASRSAAEERQAFLREVVSYQFATALHADRRPGAALVGYDVDSQLLVLGDLGSAPTMAEVIASHDGADLHHALMAWAQALGRLHAATAGREQDFAALLRRSDDSAWVDPLAAPARTALAELPALLGTHLGVPTPDAVLERAARCERLLDGGLRAFSPSDLCPGNALVTSDGVKFLDFEDGGFRDVALDAAYMLVPFPDCWCSAELSAGQAGDLVQAWRSEVVGVWPQLADDAALATRLLDAQLLWVWASTHWFLPAAPARRGPSSVHTLAHPRAEVLATRWSRLAATADALDEDAVAAHARAVAGALGA